MPDIQRQYLIFFALLTCLLCLVSRPTPVCSQNLQPAAPPPSSGNTSDGTSQKNETGDSIARFNGCTWDRTPNYSFRDVYLTLKDGTLVLYEYLKDEYYCYVTFRICFNQQELWRVKVAGYDTLLTDRQGNNLYRIVISRDGKAITIYGIDNASGREYITDKFVRSFCSDNI